MNVLAIDTSSSWCSVAFLLGSSAQSHVVRHEESATTASQLVLPWIQELMEQNQVKWSDIDAIAVSQGPGAFTGVRLGIGIAQGIALATDKPLIPVPSLDGLAAYQYLQKGPAWNEEGLALVALDARMDEVYWGLYKISSTLAPQRMGDIRLSPIEEVASSTAHIFAGNGFLVYQQQMIEGVLAKNASQAKEAWIIQADATPHALGIAYMAQQLMLNKNGAYLPGDCQPLYLRDKVAQTTIEREESKRQIISK